MNYAYLNSHTFSRPWISTHPYYGLFYEDITWIYGHGNLAATQNTLDAACIQ